MKENSRPLFLRRFLDRGHVRQLAGASGDAAVHLVDGGKVTLIALALPPVAMGERRAAAPYVAEPFLAQAIEAQCVVLGPELPPQPPTPQSAAEAGLAVAPVHLVCVIARSTLDDIEAAYPAPCRIVPEPLILPRPLPGHWLACLRDNRIVVRTPDGAGFAAQIPVFAALWTHAGKPALDWVGSEVPQALIRAGLHPLRVLQASPAPDAAFYAMDLARNAPATARRRKVRRMLAAVAVIGLLLQPALLAARVSILNHRAGQIEAALRAELDARGVPVGQSVEAAAKAMLVQGSAGQGRGFFPAFGRATAALAGFAGLIRLDSLSYDAGGAGLALGLVGPDIASVQSAAEALLASGLRVDTGTARLEDGQAKLTVTINAGAAG